MFYNFLSSECADKPVTHQWCQTVREKQLISERGCTQNNKLVLCFCSEALLQRFTQRVSASSCLSVCVSIRMNNFIPPRTHLRDILYCRLLLIFAMKIQNRTKISDTSHEQPSTFMYTARWVIVGKENVAETICRRNKIYFMRNIFFLKSWLLRDYYEICDKAIETIDHRK